MKKILTFLAFIFSISFLNADSAPEQSKKMLKVIEANEILRDINFYWIPDHLIYNSDQSGSLIYNYHPFGKCIVDIQYSLVFENGSQLTMYAYEQILMSNSAARDGIVPQHAINLIDEFTIFTGDIIFIEDLPYKFFDVTLEKNGMKIMASSIKKRLSISIDEPGLMY